MEGKSGCVAHTSFASTNSTSSSPKVTREFAFLKVMQGSLTSFLPVGTETVLTLCFCLLWLCMFFDCLTTVNTQVELFLQLEIFSAWVVFL